MHILIPTYGRAKEASQTSLFFIASLGLTPHLVVQERERHLYDWAGYPIIVLPDEIRTIAPTRDWLVQNIPSNKIVMVDDDLAFFKRSDEDRTKFIKGAAQDFIDMFKSINSALDLYAHVGIASREGGNRNTESIIKNTRIMRVLAYRTDTMKTEGITFAPREVMEDFHVSLQFLRKGYETVILNDWCHNQAGSGAAGGCSHFRTPEVQARNAELLASLHPDYVTVVDKETKGAWGGGIRKDVRVQWKKAYENG